MRKASIMALKVGDIVCTIMPKGTAKVTRIERNGLFEGPGRCFSVELLVLTGPRKGDKIVDIYAGDDKVRLPDQAATASG